MSLINEAMKELLKRKSRDSHPDGDFDNAKRWHPDKETERCECCADIRWPSRSYPFSLLTHCRSVEHVANLYEVDVKELRKAIRAEKKKGE